MPRIAGFQGAPAQGDQSKFMLALNIEVADSSEAAMVLARLQAMLDPALISRQQAEAHRVHAEREAQARAEFEAAKARLQANVEAKEKAVEARQKQAAKTSAAISPEPEQKQAAEEAPAISPEPTEKQAAEEAPAISPEPAKKTGLDPAAALAEYDRQMNGEPEAKPPATEVQEGAHYVKGQRYDGVEIVRVQTSKSQGFGVLTLVDGKKVKFDLATGHTLGVKGGPPAPEGTGPQDVEVVPTTRQGGPGAPAEDEPMADSNTPEGETPEWMQPIVDAKTAKEALVAASKHIENGDLVEWAVSMREKVPAFSKVPAKTFRRRIERTMATLAPKSKKGKAQAEASA